MKSDYVGQLVAGEYLIQSSIGGGGMAQVYLATSNKTGQQVAVKIMHSDLIHKTKAVARFKREARLSCRLSHPNLVKGFATGELDGVPFLAMEYIDGPSLSDVIEKRGTLPAAESIKIIYDIFSALNYLFMEGSLHAHRDIKPENIMLTKKGDLAKLSDFGIAKAFDDNEQVTMTSSFLGSPHYMSPEQITNPRDVDIRGDIYALGAVLYEMLTGKKAFDGESTKEILDSHFELDPPQITGDDPLVPVCNEIFNKTMAFSVTDRYQTPREVVTLLTPYIDGKLQVKAPKFSRASMRLALLIAGVFVVTCVLVAAVFAFAGKTPSGGAKTPPATSNTSNQTATTNTSASSAGNAGSSDEASQGPAAPATPQKALPGGQGGGVGISGGGTSAGGAGGTNAINNSGSVQSKNQ